MNILHRTIVLLYSVLASHSYALTLNELTHACAARGSGQAAAQIVQQEDPDNDLEMLGLDISIGVNFNTSKNAPFTHLYFALPRRIYAPEARAMNAFVENSQSVSPDGTFTICVYSGSNCYGSDAGLCRGYRESHMNYNSWTNRKTRKCATYKSCTGPGCTQTQ